MGLHRGVAAARRCPHRATLALGRAGHRGGGTLHPRDRHRCKRSRSWTISTARCCRPRLMAGLAVFGIVAMIAVSHPAATDDLTRRRT